MAADQNLLTEIKRFSSRFPRVDGVQALLADAKKYLKYQSDGSKQKFQNLSFQTPLFQSELERINKDFLPPAEITTRIENAQSHWQQGRMVDAVQILNEITDKTWRNDAQKLAKRYKDITARYENLYEKRGTKGYQEELFSFHSILEPAQDRYYLTMIEGEFKKYRDNSKVHADKLLKTAAEGLKRFRQKGGIQRVQRLDEQLTEGFHTQASLLAMIHSLVTQSQQVYQVLQLELDQEQRVIYKSITEEMELQRTALNDLSSILSVNVLESKLQLLAGSD
jgi:hypothetical protein